MSINLVALEGTLSRPAERRELPSGGQLVSLDVTVRRDGGRAETVPVVWPDAPAWASALDAGTQVVVVGRVRRRFFSAGGATQSRTEVVADAVVKASSSRRARALLAGAGAAIDAAAAGIGKIV